MKKIFLFIIPILVAMVVPAIGNAETKSFDTDFGLGTRGEYVKELQMFLTKNPSLYPEGLVTGYFGPATERAVRRFQKENNLEQAGRVGPKTRGILNALLNGGTVGFTSSQHVPMIFEIFATSTTPNTAYVFWSSNAHTTSEFWLSTTSPVNTLTAYKFTNTHKGMYHYQNISGLATSTKYYYLIKITDERRNSATSTESSFVTSSI